MKRKLIWFNLAVICLMLLSASGCGSRPATPTHTPIPPTRTPLPPTPTSRAQTALDKLVADSSPLPPQVVNPATEISAGGPVEVAFDRPMDQTATQSAWSLVGPDGKAVEGKLSWSDPRTLRFTPAQPLKGGAIYLATFSQAAKSADGAALREPLRLKFDVTGDLGISQVFPAPDTSGVDNKAVITVLFNRPVVPLVTAEDQSSLPSPLSLDPPVAGKGEWVSTSVYTFHPDKPLQNAVTFHAVIKAGLSSADGGGSVLAQDFAWQFTTVAPSIDYLNAGKLESPQDGQIDIPLEASFTVGFHQAMDEASVQASLSLTASSGENAPLDLKWDKASSVLAITPRQRLQYGTAYTLSLAEPAQAAGGGGLDKPLNWSFTTVQAPGIVFTDPVNGVYGAGQRQFSIKFASPMSITGLVDKVVFNPPLEPDQSSGMPGSYYNEYDTTLSFYGLKASTTYQVKIQPGMADIYGRTIEAGQSISFSTNADSPWANLLMPWQALYRADGPQEFYIQYVNVDSIDFKLYRLTKEDLASYLEKGASPSTNDLVWTHTEAGAGKLNQRVVKKVTLQDASGKPLAPGIYSLVMDSPSITSKGNTVDSRVLVVASASITLKGSLGEALLWVTGLTDGKPVSGMPLTVYDQQFNPLGQGVTGQDGLLHLVLPGAGQAAVYAMSDDSQQFAFTSLNWGSGVSPYQFGISQDYYGPQMPEKAYVYTDRPIYRPGQPVYFKGIVRMDDDLAYTLPGQSKLEVTIESYNETIYDETLALSPYGTFDGKFVLDQGAALGSYLIKVKIPGNDTPAGAVNFNVAEYRRPEFIVNVTAQPGNLLSGEKFTALVKADYYSGGAVAGAQVDWTLRALPFTFTPPETLQNYSFTDFALDTGDLYRMPNQPDSVVIAQGTGQTDGQGQLALSLPAQLDKSGASQTLTFEATLTDLSGNAVSGRADVIAHQSAVYVGVQPGDYVGAAGKVQTFNLVVVDWQGTVQPGQKVDVDIVERRWYSVQQQDQQGNLTWDTTVKEIPVTSFKDQVAGTDGKLSVTFIPPNGGVFAARAAVRDAHGNISRASAYIWVVGSDYIPWRQTNDRSFQLVADQASYKPGDKAQLLIASPFQGSAYALVTIERGHTRKAEVIQLTSNSTVYELTITADMAPNVYASVLIVKGVDETNPRPNFKVGMVKIKVATDEQALNVSLATDKTQAGPGDKVTYTLRVTDGKGQPVRAEVSLGLSDLATLSLSAPNSQPLIDYFYAPRNLGVVTAVAIVASAEDYNAALSPTSPEGKGGGSGGGKGSGYLGVMDIRQNFPDTAYWEAHLTTGEDGQASATVTLPDNLTTWRMDARAVTQDTRVGQAILDITSSRPLLVRPQTPRFFVAGDAVTLGAAVHNNTDQDLDVTVSLDGKGISLTGESTQAIHISARQQAYVTWAATVNSDAARVDLVFSAASGNLQDASRPTAGTLDNGGLPVYRYEANETVGTSGQLNTGGARVEAINLPSGWATQQGTLTLELAPSLAASMTDGLNYLESYPYECTEQTISSFLPNVLTTRVLQAAGLSSPDLEAKLKEQVNQAMQRLANRQNADGGWGWWPGLESQVLTSAYVIQGMVEARDAGYDVSEDVLRRGLAYLHSSLTLLPTLSPTQKLNQQAFVLYVLARAGEAVPSFNGQLYDTRQSLSLYARAYLAQALYKVDAKDTRLATLLSDFNNAALLSATGAHWEESFQDDWNWNTDIRSTAIILDTVILLNPSSDLNANAVRWLMSNRSGGYWKSTQETAWVLIALTDWIKTSGELNANYDYAAALNGKEVTSGSASSATIRQVQTLRLDVSTLLADQANRLVIARSDGTGSLYYTAHLDVSVPADKVTRLDRGFAISRQYYSLEDLKTPITSAKPGDMLLARLTVVTPNERHYVVIDDPLPAGLEGIDTSLLTSPQALQPQEYDWNKLDSSGYGWWFFNHVELRDSKVVLSADYLPAGTYVYTYYVRAVTPGSFRTIPPTAQEFYFPEVYGRGDGSLFEVKQP